VGNAYASESLEEAFFSLANTNLNSSSFSAFSWKGTLRSSLLESDAGNFCRDQRQIRFASEKGMYYDNNRPYSFHSAKESIGKLLEGEHQQNSLGKVSEH
jgi:hypothetical protein